MGTHKFPHSLQLIRFGSTIPSRPLAMVLVPVESLLNKRFDRTSWSTNLRIRPLVVAAQLPFAQGSKGTPAPTTTTAFHRSRPESSNALVLVLGCWHCDY